MTENEELPTTGMYSKFWRITLVVISMLLMFVGPTYVPYLMTKANIDLGAAEGLGIVLFIAGIAFMMFLAQKKILKV